MAERKRKKSRYRRAEGKRLIEVRVRNPQQLFDARDPAPFRERDLDDDFVEYVVGAAREFSHSTSLKVVIYVDSAESQELPRDSIREAIHEYFSYRIDMQRHELKAFARRTQIYLGVGLLILASCVGAAQSLNTPEASTSVEILREGLVIIGWVSIWKPIELVLYDWYPLFEKLRFYKKLLETEIEIRFLTPKTST